MKREFLTSLLGENATKEVVDAIMAENGRDIELYKSQATVLRNTNDELTQQMNGYKDKYKDIDIEKYNSALASNETLKASIKQMKADHEAEISNIHKRNALNSALSSFKFSSTYAQDGIAKQIETDGYELDDNGKIKDFDNIIKNLQETHKDAFILDNGNNEGKKPTIMTPMGSSGGSQPTPEEYLKERYKNNPFVKF
jgi:hypothetical protein